MSQSTSFPRSIRRILLLPVLLASVALSASVASAQAAGKPTIVFVHGAFADASGWSGEMQILSDKGYKVLAPANPLRGVAADAASLKAVLATVKGPIVLVGHSYGGVVITNAATGNANVKGLVYVAAYAPDQGDSVMSLETLAPGGGIGPKTLDFHAYPLVDGTSALEGTIKQDVFRRIFAADVPAKTAAIMAASQRPASLSALGEPTGVPAWKTIPSWYLISGKDNAIGTPVERLMAKRIHPRKTIEVKGASHAVLISQPEKTASLILDAAKSVG